MEADRPQPESAPSPSVAPAEDPGDAALVPSVVAVVVAKIGTSSITLPSGEVVVVICSSDMMCPPVCRGKRSALRIVPARPLASRYDARQIGGEGRPT